MMDPASAQAAAGAKLQRLWRNNRGGRQALACKEMRMAEMPKSAAQQAAEAQAFLAAHAYFDQRSQWQSLLAYRPGVCLAQGLSVQQQWLDSDFDLDPAVWQALLRAPPGTPVMRAAPAAMPPLRQPSAAAAGEAGSLLSEFGDAAFGGRNALANSSAAVAGAVLGKAELDFAARMRQGLQVINSGQARTFKLSPTMELYNTYSPSAGRPPSVRLRVRQLPLTVLEQRIPAIGGAQNQWRPNAGHNVNTLRARQMTPQQMRNVAVLAAEQTQPGWVRWVQSRRGTGVLAVAPSLAVDLYNATEVDLRQREFSFNGQQFLVDSARSQSGNAVGVLGGLGTVAVVGALSAGAIAGAPLVLIGLGGGIVLQALWSYAGADDAAGSLMRRALQ